MNTEELFIDSHNLPEPLSDKEIRNLIIKVKSKDKDAEKVVVYHNIRLVLKRVMNFKNIPCDKKELVSIGNIGLIKAIRTFDTKSSVHFSTYAARCIDNEILMFLRKLKRRGKLEYLEDKVYINESDGTYVPRINGINSGVDIETEYVIKEFENVLSSLIDKLSPLEKEIITHYFGLYNKEKIERKEMAVIYNMSLKQVTNIKNRALDKLAIKLLNRGFLPMNEKEEKKLRDIIILERKK